MGRDRLGEQRKREDGEELHGGMEILSPSPACFIGHSGGYINRENPTSPATIIRELSFRRRYG